MTNRERCIIIKSDDDGDLLVTDVITAIVMGISLRLRCCDKLEAAQMRRRNEGEYGNYSKI